MKKNVMVLGVVALAMSSFISLKNVSGIQGSIDPANGASKVMAISGTDTVSAIPVEGKFSLDVKAGTWKVIVEAVKPYKNAVKENILVGEDGYADAGVIKLESE